MAVTIEKIALEEIGKDKQTKPVLYFQEAGAGMVCNKTNARTIARLLGSEEFDDWIGKVIRLFRTEVDFQGDLVEAIRVRSKPDKPAPKVKAVTTSKSPEPELDQDGIPF